VAETKRSCQFSECGHRQTPSQPSRNVPALLAAVFSRKTRHLNAKVVGRLLENFRQRNACKPAGCGNLVAILGRLDQVLDPRDKLLAADQPTLDRGGERVVGRVVDAGVNKPSIGRCGESSAVLSLPDAIHGIVGEPLDPFALPCTWPFAVRTSLFAPRTLRDSHQPQPARATLARRGLNACRYARKDRGAIHDDRICAERIEMLRRKCRRLNRFWV
jgi:hypothetical protein